MKIEPLSITSVEILTYLSSKLRESFTVRQIANGIGKDYKITHVMTMRLAEQKYIIAEKRRPATYCKLNLKDTATLLGYIEGIRASRFLAKHRDIQIIVNHLREKIVSPFFTMIIYGSNVRGTSSKSSDLDVLFVIPDKAHESQIASSVGSVERMSPIRLHEVTLNSDEFVGLLKERRPNVAWEALDNRIVPYGAESLFRMLEVAA
jgi:predicted nucleotidyltransferase